MANIADFKANMTGGGARPNQFRVDLAFPLMSLVEELLLYKDSFFAKLHNYQLVH